MDRRRKWKYRALAVLQVLAAAAIAGAVICLLYRYVQYGERFARETGQRGSFADPEIAETENSGDESAGTEDSGGEFAGAGSSGAERGERLPATIRVRILTDDFSGRCHDRVELSSEEAFAVKQNGKRVRKGKSYRVSVSELEEGQVLEIAGKSGETLTVESLNRADGHPRYAGTLWLHREAEGIALINELPLEEYLCGVVASEMPSDYPQEAQKAQAVCARTYACNCIRNVRGKDMSEGTSEDSQGDKSGGASEGAQNVMPKSLAEDSQEDTPEGTTGGLQEDESEGMTRGLQGGGLEAEQETAEEKAWSAPAADLDDSVNYQVYNNYQATEQSRQAVEATEGEILPLGGIQYYSTSCQTEHRDDLGSDVAFREFLSKEPDAGAEYGSPWLRWETEISAKDILRELEARYGWQEGRIDEIRVAKRAGNGQVQELEVRCGDSATQVKGEYAIRQLLSPAQTVIRLMDGEGHSGMELLPSAFFWLEPERIRLSGNEPESEEGVCPIARVTIHGGGYGHGTGMSQCGAAAMAKKGLDYREILEYYYQCEVSG